MWEGLSRNMFSSPENLKEINKKNFNDFKTIRILAKTRTGSVG